MTKSYDRETAQIGTRHLRVGLEIGAKSIQVTSLWLVEQPAIQGPVLPRDLLTQVLVVGQEAFVESFDDPRVARGVYRKNEGHSYLTSDTGVFYVSVPFSSVEVLRSLVIQTVPMTNVQLPTRSTAAYRALFRDPPAQMRPLYEITAEDIQRHRDWPKVAKKLGLDVPAGRFEIYIDRKKEYRWRLRRSDGEIMADSGEGYNTREQCEEDLRWVRRHAAEVPIVFLTPNSEH